MAAHAETARVLVELYERVPLGMRLGLGPMTDACARAGNPERAFACVHVAGTNGKGSVSALIESTARAAGLRTGLYTSPHLSRFAERIRIDGEALDDDRFAAVMADALRIGHDLSFFETATFAAFLAFRAAGVELAVLEVGLGGRLDATNVIGPPRLSVVTRIALDHQDRLGHSLAEIAGEKAGIAKPGAPLLVGETGPEALAVITNAASTAGAPLVHVADVPVPAALPSLPGAYQRDNARIAAAACVLLGLEAHVEAGFAGASWPGRFEWLDLADGAVLLDAAHNPDGAQALGRALDEAAALPEGPRSLRDRPRALVFGSLADKSFAETLPLVASRFDAGSRFYAEPRGRAPATPSALAELVPGVPCASLADALARARARVGPHGVVVVCGSIYLVGEARTQLLGLPADPPVAL